MDVKKTLKLIFKIHVMLVKVKVDLMKKHALHVEDVVE